MDELEPLKLKPTCLNVRHKMMYLDSRQQTPGLVDDSTDTRVFWCLKTHDALGPDGKPVSPDECGTSRECHCHGV